MLREDAERVGELLAEIVEDCRACEKLVPGPEDQGRLGLRPLVDAAERALEAVERERTEPGHKSEQCSFCGKRETEVGRLIAGRAALICDDCVALCGVIVSDHGGPRRATLDDTFTGHDDDDDDEGPVSSVRSSESPPRE